MKEKISKLILSSDFFGKVITFEDNNEQTVKNIVTGAITIIMYSIIIVLSYFFGKELWERKKPSSFLNEIKVINAEYEMIEFPVIFFIANESLRPLNVNLDVYDIGLQTVFYKNNIPDYSSYLIQEECDITQFPKRFQSQLQLITTLIKENKYTPLCFPFIPEAQIISSNSLTLELTNIVLRIFNCNDDQKFGGIKYTHSKPLKKCDKETPKYNKTFRLLFYFLNNFIDVSNETDPLEIDRTLRNVIIDTQYQTQMDFFISSVQLKSDNGWIIEDTKIYDSLVLSEVQYQLSYNNSEIELLFSGVFQVTNNKKIINRKYLKIQELLATIGGMFNGILITLKILTYDFSKYIYNKEFRISELKTLLNNYTKENIKILKEEKYANLNDDNENKTKNQKIAFESAYIQNLANDLNNIKKCELDLKEQLEELEEISYFKYILGHIVACFSNNKNSIIKVMNTSESRKKFSFKEYIKIYYSNLEKENN